MPGELVKPVS